MNHVECTECMCKTSPWYIIESYSISSRATNVEANSSEIVVSRAQDVTAGLQSNYTQQRCREASSSRLPAGDAGGKLEGEYHCCRTEQFLSYVKSYTDKSRWIPEAAKRTCSSPTSSISFVATSLKPLLAAVLSTPLTKVHRAVLRIIAELERCPPEKVCIHAIS